MEEITKSFIDRKEEFVKVLENYLEDQDQEKLIQRIGYYKGEMEFMNKELFANIINEFNGSFSELSTKDIKQRILLIKSYL